MAPSPMQVIVAVALVATITVYWFFLGRGRWRARLEERFLYGVPWGTAVTVAFVVAFYLFAQGGLTHWDEPVVWAFASWSYFYPLGMVTAGISHGSPAHLISNMAGTLALAPIAEYAWSHYSGGDRSDAGDDSESGSSPGDEQPASSRTDDWVPDDELLPDGASLDDDRSFLDNPWIRAVVIFPGALLAASLITSIYALGPSVGFSGAVYAIIGFALVTYPLKSVVAVVVASSLGTLWNAVTNPIVTQGVEAGGPAPPSWAGIAFQAHGLGFLLGVFAGLGVLYLRSRRPSTERVLLGVLLVGLVQSLWLLVLPADADTFTLYRGPGVVIMFLAAGLVALAAGGERSDSLVSKRKVAIAALAAFAVLLALPSLFLGIVVVDDGGVEGAQSVEIRDYTVAYADNVTSGHASGIGQQANESPFASEVTWVVVTSERREVWTRAVRADALEHSGNETVAVGGIGWHQTVRVQRRGWTVAGNDTVYAIDLHHDGETTRSFASEPSTADVSIDGYTATVVPTNEAFEVRVQDGSGVVDTVPIPETNSSRSVDGIVLSTEFDGGARQLYMETDDGRAILAEAESYD